ncbi:MAG: zf-HC2 domain-containing protein [Acidobacteriota bacterium]|nr:zf-HC2 domain-containing protein [Acidobacteriota bacterium]
MTADPMHLDAAVLADYWLGALDAVEEARVEEHVFACGDCAALLDEVRAMAEGVRQVARSGVLMTTVSQEFLEYAKAEGLQIRQYAPPVGGSVQCTVSAEDDFLIGRLEVDLREAKRVDLSLCGLDGSEQFRLTDIPFSHDDDAVLWQMSIRFAKAAPTSSMVAKLVNVDESGTQSVMGEYTFHHTRTLPGPGAW